MKMGVLQRILLGSLLLAAGFAVGCESQSRAKVLAQMSGLQTRRDAYFNLMTPLQQADYQLLEVRGKPTSLKLAYLQEIGVYQKWAELPKEMQDAILHRKVLEGMTPDEVQMSWGPGENKTDVSEPADRAESHTKVVWNYVFRTKGTGGAYERSVCFYDDQVLWVRDTQ
jgi:hypothetical protein